MFVLFLPTVVATVAKEMNQWTSVVNFGLADGEGINLFASPSTTNELTGLESSLVATASKDVSTRSERLVLLLLLKPKKTHEVCLFRTQQQFSDYFSLVRYERRIDSYAVRRELHRTERMLHTTVTVKSATDKKNTCFRRPGYIQQTNRFEFHHQR